MVRSSHCEGGTERERNGTGGGDGGRKTGEWGAKRVLGKKWMARAEGAGGWRELRSRDGGREEGRRGKMEKSWMCLGERCDQEEMKEGKI